MVRDRQGNGGTTLETVEDKGVAMEVREREVAQKYRKKVEKQKRWQRIRAKPDK